MAKSKTVRGFYGPPNGKSVEGGVKLTFLSRGLNETLSVEFLGMCRLDLQYRPVEQLVRDARAELTGAGAGSGREKSAVVIGQYTDAEITLTRGRITVWYRGGNPAETLSLIFENAGQITVPLAPLLGLVGAERAMRA